MIRLQIFAGGQVERDESFASSEVTIGRTNANRLCLPANGVSARHCVIRRLGAGFELEDLESTNGTYVNRRRVRGRVLVGPQDEIIVATFTIRLVDVAAQTRVEERKAKSEPKTLLSQSPKGRAAKTFAPPLLPADESPTESPTRGEGADVATSLSNEQWPQPLPALEGSKKGASASGSFKLQAVASSDPQSKEAYRVIEPLAQAWRHQGKPEILLLEGEQLIMAERWIERPNAQPQPQALHREFIEQSSTHSKRQRSRWVWAPLALVGVLGVAFGISRFALDKDMGIELPKDVADVLPRVKSRSSDAISPTTLEPWLDKDPQSAVLASVSSLKALGEQQNAETWAWESFLRKALRRTGAVVLAKMPAPVSAMVMLPTRKGWAIGAQDGTMTVFMPGNGAVTVMAHEGSIRSLMVDKEGRWLFSWGQDHVLKRWNLSKDLSETKPQVLKGLSAAPIAVALSPSGRHFAAAGDQGELRVWSAQAADPNDRARSLGSSTARVTALLWDQGRLLVGDEKGKISGWSMDGQKERNSIDLGEGIAEMVATPDQKVLLVRGQERRSFRVRKKGPRWGKVTGLGEIAASGILKLDHKGRFAISVATEGEIVMWDPQSPDPARISVVIEGPGTAIEAMALDSRDQRMLAADDQGTLWSWDLAPKDGRIAPQKVYAQPSDTGVDALIFDGHMSRWLMASGDGTVRAIDVGATLNQDASFVGRGHRGRVRTLAVNEQGTQVLSGADDQRVRLWSLGAGGRIGFERTLTGHRTPVTAVAFDQSGRFAYGAAQDGSILTWDLQHPKKPPARTRNHSAEVYDMLVTKDGKWLISVGADAKVLAYALKDGVMQAPKPLSGHKQAIFTVASDPQSHYSISAGQDRGVVVWDLSKGLSEAEGWRLDGHDKAIWAVAVSPDLKWIASAGEDRRIHVHRVDALAKREPPAHVLSGHKGTINALAFSPDGRWLVSGGADRDLLAWDLSAKQPHEAPLRLSGHAQGVRALGFVAPGRLVSASRDGALRIWNLHQEEASSELLGHSAAVEDQVVARNGGLVVTGSQDKTLRVWPIARGSLLRAACQRVRGEMDPELAAKVFKGKEVRDPCEDLRGAPREL